MNKEIEMIESYNEILRAKVAERVRGELLALIFRLIESSTNDYKREKDSKNKGKAKSQEKSDK